MVDPASLEPALGGVDALVVTTAALNISIWLSIMEPKLTGAQLARPYAVIVGSDPRQRR